MSILLPQRWRQQPPYRTDIDWSNPLAKRLRLAQTSSGGLVDLVNQWPATKAASDEIRGVNIPRLGSAVSFKGARATGGGINFGQVQAVKTDTITVLILANPNTTQAQTVFSQRAGSSPFNQFSFAVNSNGALSLDSGRIVAVCLPVSGSARNSISVGNTFTDGGWHVYVTTFAGDPAYPIIYYDGASVAVNNSLTGTGTWVSSAQHTRIGNVADYTTDANYAASCDIPLCLVWDRVLSADEVRQISANPWQIFQPIRSTPVSFDQPTTSYAALLPEKQWRRQPRAPVQIDRNNALTRNLVQATTPDFNDPAKGLITSSGVVTRFSSQRGLLYNFDGTSYIQYVNVEKITPPFTVAFDVIFQTIGFAVFQPIVCQGGAGVTGGFGVKLASNGVRLTFGGVADYTVSSTTFTTNTLYRICVTVSGNGGTAIAYSGGSSIGSVAVGTINAATSGTLIGADAATGRATNGTRIGNVALWNRALSAGEVKSFADNPWQVFQPLRGIPVAFDTGGGAQTLTPSLYTNNQTFYSPTVTPGAVTLSPGLYTNQQTFYGPTLTATVTVSPSLYTNQQTFYGPTATPGTVTLQPALYTNTQSFYTPSVNQTGAVVYPSLFTNTNIFFAAEAINEYPDPSQVEFGVKYGPGGTLVGTLTGGGGSSIIRLRSFTERH